RIFLIPDLPIGAGTRNQAVTGFLRQSGDLCADGRDEGIGATYHTPAVIAAGSNGVQPQIADALHQRPQRVLADTMQLNGLAGGDADTALSIQPGNTIDALPLLHGEATTWNAHPNHELIVRLELSLQPAGTQVPIILLIDAVEFHQQRIITGDCTGQSVTQSFADRPTQVATARLQLFVGIQRLDVLGNVTTSVYHAGHDSPPLI